nr:hypothetical protein CFP56_60179 [Quercus suber]
MNFGLMVCGVIKLCKRRSIPGEEPSNTDEPSIPGEAFQAPTNQKPTTFRRSIPGEEPSNTDEPSIPGEAFQAPTNPGEEPSNADEQDRRASERRRRFLHQTPTNPATPTAKHEEHADFFTRPRRTQQHRRRSTKNTPISSPDPDEARTQAPISSPEPRRRTRSGTAKHEEHASLVVRICISLLSSQPVLFLFSQSDASKKKVAAAAKRGGKTAMTSSKSATASDSSMVADGFVGFAMVVIDGGRWVCKVCHGGESLS